jgi:flagellum-specific peptidoglycan hydrolase FlgJ
MRIITTFIAVLLVLNLWGQNKRKITRSEYIETYKGLAMTEMRRTGIPASITLAQGILESGNGNSTLAVKANNHFGIKCHDWNGPSIKQDDDRKNECFRKYRNPEKSYKDHSDFLTGRSRYAFLFDLKPDDYKAWARGLKKAGYATSSSYASALIKIIE